VRDHASTLLSRISGADTICHIGGEGLADDALSHAKRSGRDRATRYDHALPIAKGPWNSARAP